MDGDGGSEHGAWRGGAPAPTSSVAGAGRSGFARDRAHRFPGRRHALKVLYDDVEVASVRQAAELPG